MEEYLLPCLNKELFGIECMGCGIQRAAVLVFKGEFTAAFKMYPAIYTLILLTGLVVFNFFVKFKFDTQLKIGLLFLNLIIIIIGYLIKNQIL